MSGLTFASCLLLVAIPGAVPPEDARLTQELGARLAIEDLDDFSAKLSEFKKLHPGVNRIAAYSIEDTGTTGQWTLEVLPGSINDIKKELQDKDWWPEIQFVSSTTQDVTEEIANLEKRIARAEQIAAELESAPLLQTSGESGAKKSATQNSAPSMIQAYNNAMRVQDQIGQLKTRLRFLENRARYVSLTLDVTSEPGRYIRSAGKDFFKALGRGFKKPMVTLQATAVQLVHYSIEVVAFLVVLGAILIAYRSRTKKQRTKFLAVEIKRPWEEAVVVNVEQQRPDGTPRQEKVKFQPEAWKTRHIVALDDSDQKNG